MNKRDAVTGALVGDAATMGLHWLYNQERLAQIDAAGEILFRAPDEKDFEGPDGSLGYFAHAARAAGQNSQYGACVDLVSSLVETGEAYTPARHQDSFFQTFGPGGSFVGFADRPTKALVLRLLQDGDALEAESGSDDDQLPALESVPGLFAAGAGEDVVAQAVKVTSTNDVALDGALTLYRCLDLVSAGRSLSDALEASAAQAGPALRDLLQEALAWKAYEPLAVTAHFGLPCHMPQGLPVVWHIAKHAPDFEQAIRANILSGGDSCGRVVGLGSIAGLVHGVPEHLRTQATDVR